MEKPKLEGLRIHLTPLRNAIPPKFLSAVSYNNHSSASPTCQVGPALEERAGPEGLQATGKAGKEEVQEPVCLQMCFVWRTA